MKLSPGSHADPVRTGHRDIAQDATEQREVFLALHTKLNLGEVDQRMALLWWSNGWVMREAIHPERWGLTDEGKRIILCGLS